MNPKLQILTGSRKVAVLLATFTMSLTHSCRKDTGVVENPQAIDSTSTNVKKIALKPNNSNHSCPHLQSFRSTVTYSIDLDGDDVNDIEVSLQEVQPMAGLLLGTFVARVKTLNGKTYILTDSVYYISNSTYRGDTLLSENKTQRNELYPRPLKYRDVLKLNDRWRSGTFNLLEYGESIDQTAMTRSSYYSSSWPEFNNFIGIKCRNRLA